MRAGARLRRGAMEAVAHLQRERFECLLLAQSGHHGRAFGGKADIRSSSLDVCF
jgi:hypothetical protein